tara:strand:+ start:2616 stop:2930 length:315 start_codon:yes stop_codon:yes gene_type:complete
MKTNTEINSKVNDTLHAVKTIKTVEVSPFFKDKVLQQIFNIPKEKVSPSWAWFTPKMQFATLACVIILNIIALNNIKETTYHKNIDQFANSYGLSKNTTTLIQK